MKVRFVLAALLGMAMVADVPTVAIMDISGNFHRIQPYSGVQTLDRINERVESRVAMSLVHSKRFQVLERANIGAILDEGKFSISIFADESGAVSLGKQLGAKFIVIGSMQGGLTHPARMDSNHQEIMPRPDDNDCFGSLELSLKVVNTETGVICDVVELTAKANHLDEASSIDEMMSILSIKLDEAIPNITVDPVDSKR